MATKTFDSKKSERPSFEVAGQTFTCRAKLSYRKFKALFADFNDSDDAAMVKIEDFFNVVLLPGDRDRFKELLDKDDEDDDENVIELHMVNEIVQWLVGHYSGNASGQPATS